MIRLHGDGWASPPVALATSFGHRLRGLRRPGEGHGLLLRGRFVHGRGLAEAITVCALDPAGTVIEVRELAPGRFAAFSSAHWLLELPVAVEPPMIGARLTVTAPSADLHRHGGHPLRRILRPWQAP